MTRRSSIVVIAGVLLGATGLGSCVPRQGSDVYVGEMILELGEAITTLREDNAHLQAQIDSLRIVAARQDTAMQMIANVVGVPLPRR